MEMFFLHSTRIWRLWGQTAKLPGHLSQCKPAWPYILFFLTLQAVSDVPHCYAHSDQALLKFRHGVQQNTGKVPANLEEQNSLYPAADAFPGWLLLPSLLSQAGLSIPGPVQSLPHAEVSRAGQGDGRGGFIWVTELHTAKSSFPVTSANCSQVYLHIIMEAGNFGQGKQRLFSFSITEYRVCYSKQSNIMFDPWHCNFIFVILIETV